MRTRHVAVVGVVVVAALAGCRSAGKATPQGPAAPVPDFLNAYVGQRRVLVHQGAARTIVAGKGGAPAGTCDVAVEVQRLSLGPGGLRLVVETLGVPRLGDGAGGKGCKGVPHVRTIDVAGVTGTTTPDAVAAAVDPLLPTPEAYLAAHGAPFDLPAAKTPPTVAARPAPQGNDDERRLGRQVTTWPKLLLAVDPVFYDLSGKPHYQSELVFDGIVGADGRLYTPQLESALGQTHERVVMGALTFWRYEPARKGTDPVAAHVEGRCTFSID